MASLVGHALGSAAAWSAGRRLEDPGTPPVRGGLVLASFLAVLPDLDVLPPLIWPSLEGVDHRGPSHSLLGAVVLTALVALLGLGLQRGVRFGRLFKLLLPCALVHPVLDWAMRVGPGVQFLWPLDTEGFLSPVQLVPTAWYPLRWEGITTILGMRMTWVGIALEVLSIGAVCFAIRARQAAARAWLLSAILAFAAIALLYNEGGPLAYVA